MQLPPWHWAYAAFKLADGITHGLVALAIILWYDGAAWMVALTAAIMNLAGVPAAFAWGKAMDGGQGRRRAAVAGFAFAAFFLLIVATGPTLILFVIAVTGFTVFGVATAPAASYLILEAAPRRQWGAASGALARRTGMLYVAGMTFTVGLAFAGRLHLPTLFAAAALLSLGAAAVAWRTIPPYDPARTPTMQYNEDVARAAPRRIERAIYFPGRLWYRPTGRSVRLPDLAFPTNLLVALTLLFAGTVTLLGGYPGILADELGYGPGLILLATSPAAFLTLAAYGTAGRYGGDRGEGPGLRMGGMLRLVAIPGLAAALLLGADALPLLLVLHGLMGISFAFLQVNGPCLIAQHHPRGRGAGVGAFHAAVAAGTLAGSVLSAALLWSLPVWSVYVASAFLTSLGIVALFAAVRRVPGGKVPPSAATGE